MFEVLKIVLFTAMALVLAPYTLIALGGIAVGVWRQLRPGKQSQ